MAGWPAGCPADEGGGALCSWVVIATPFHSVFASRDSADPQHKGRPDACGAGVVVKTLAEWSTAPAARRAASASCPVPPRTPTGSSWYISAMEAMTPVACRQGTAH